ncbi:MAG: MmgE/PrpD family protein, partial [Deltaproteobacteria bacterium]|nr:MmgE/PrpD family protein [Deltaproteobacteria bacterium]
MGSLSLPAIAKFATDTSYNDIPDEVSHQAKRTILDTIGTGLAGYVTDTGRAARKIMRDLGGKPECTVIVSGEKNSCANTAFANAKMANALDMDDCFGNLVHFSPVTLFAPLAMAERNGSTGKELIEAFTLGYDIAARIMLYAGHLIFTRSSPFACHIFGAAAGTGKILRLDEETMMHAIGTAALSAPIPLPMVGASSPTTSVKYGDAGMVSWLAIVSCLAAIEGYATNPRLLDGFGAYWSSMLSTDPDYKVLTDGLGEKWWIMESAIKAYPICRHNNKTVDMYKDIAKKNNLKPEDIESITFKTGPVMADPRMHWAESDPRDAYGAQFSIPHAMAMAAFDVPPGPQWQTKEIINDPKIREFRHRVKFEVDEKDREIMEAQKAEGGRYPRKMPMTIEIEAKGETYTDHREITRGDPW